jgi:histidyl-tRNA synthetase
LKEKELLPNLQLDVDCIVFPLEEVLRPQAGFVANQLRNAGYAVELVLENKKMKW